MGIDPAVVHLNEGHAAFASLELARSELAAGASLDDALAEARARTVFTTHTPVPAGNDTYATDLVCDSLRTLADELGVDLDTIVRLGRTRPDDDGEPFGVTQFALRTSRAANGVSRRHGEVAREMWAALWPDRSVDEVPIGYVTNGVHLPTWVGDPDAHAARPPPRRRLDGSRRGPGHVGRAPRRRRRRAVGRAPRAARRAGRPGRASAAWSTASAATSRASTSRRRTSTPTC